MSRPLPPISEEEISHINVYGARVHNLKNIDVHIPRNQLVVITGLSGSGKSSLAFDTIFAEGQRRYLESLSGYARQFMGTLERPDVDNITGLSPVVSIEQKTTNRNPRSTVGTVTELHDFLRLLYARVSKAFSYNTGEEMVKFSEEEIIENIEKKLNQKKVIILAPVVRGRKGHYRELFVQIQKQGFLKVRVDGEIIDIHPKLQLDRYKIHDIEIVIDRIKVNPEDPQRLRHAVAEALRHGEGLLFIQDVDSGKLITYSKHLMCPTTGISYEEPSPNSFSFNSPYGYCPECKGLGMIDKVDIGKVIPNSEISIKKGGITPLGEYKESHNFKMIKSIASKFNFSLDEPIRNIPEQALKIILEGTQQKEALEVEMEFNHTNSKYKLDFEGINSIVLRSYNDHTSEPIRRWAESFITQQKCPSCQGYRLRKESLYFKIGNKHIGNVAELDIENFYTWISGLAELFDEKRLTISRDILKELNERTGFLMNVGLDYISLDRPTGSLSGGESQRIRLATQIGSQLSGITYILDEPSIGLHQRDNARLINALVSLRDTGNSVIVVEHDEEIMQACDYIIDIGPFAGEHGGKIVAQGDLKTIANNQSLTAQYLSGKKKIEIPKERRNGNGINLILKGAKGNNLQNVEVTFPLGKFICVTGVSGSGKSTLINETLYRILNKHIYNGVLEPLPYDSIEGLEHIDKVIEIDQSPIGRTPRSNPATYTGLFDEIRKLFAEIPEAKIRGYQQGRFSFNVKGGRCEECQGAGLKTIEMNFLPDVNVLCPECNGKRYNNETLEIKYKGKNINDVLEMTIEESATFFESIPKIIRKINALNNVGLGYIKLGQQATTLSGGEAQRVKLAEELSKKDTGKTFYILDEPTTGLHFEDINVLLQVLQKLVDRGNTVLVIEHNMDVIKVADHIIDIGPEGGKKGGRVVSEGTPEQVASDKGSITGKYLKKVL